MNPFSPEFLAQFHFLRPLFLLALVPAVLLVLLLRYLHSMQSNWQQAIDPRLLPYLLDRNASPQQSWPLYGLLVLWILGAIALAGPAWEQQPVPVQEREDSLVLVLDLSLSMYAQDQSPNRATRAQRKLIDILALRSREGQTGLVVYAGSAHAVTPMTDDVETIRNLVPSLQPGIMPVLGSKPAEGVRVALDLLSNSALTQGHILLMTDGITSSDSTAILALFDGDNEHRLSVMGFGTEDGGPIPMGAQGFLRDDNNAIVIPRLQRAPLQQLADAGGGRYSDVRLNDDDLRYLLDDTVFAGSENLVEVDREYDTWLERGPWLLLLALPLAALAFRRGWLLSLCLAGMLLPVHEAQAVEWRDLWQRKDQQASASFTAEQYDNAAALFRDQQWRAAANYRSGNYQQAAEDLDGLDTPDTHYNRGNALARLGQLPEAIAAYEQTLAQDPDHADAQHNKQLVEELLEQQQQEQQQQQQNQGDQQEQQQDQEQQDGQQGQQNQEQQNQDQQQQQQDQQQNQDQQGEQQEQQQDQQQQSEQDSEQQPEEQQEQQQPSDSSQRPNTEEEQAMQQWLQRIPDDPGELLRNKFRYQSQQRLFQQLQNPGQGDQQAAEQIW